MGIVTENRLVCDRCDRTVVLVKGHMYPGGWRRVTMADFNIGPPTLDIAVCPDCTPYISSAIMHALQPAYYKDKAK
jgi:hypothetical protein